MTLPPLTYLTVDSLAEGVGASQVLPYVERLAQRGLEVTVHSFEHGSDHPEVQRRLDAAGVQWHPQPFGAPGGRGGVRRVLRLAQATRGAELVHARSDLAAAAALLGRSGRWVWDVRSFFADQRIELGMLRRGSSEERVLRVVERRAARSAHAVITLASAAIPALESRHGPGVAAKATVIPTCVDLDRFRPSALPGSDVLRLLFSGSLNRYYDVPLMLRLYERARRRGATELTVLAPGETPWDPELTEAGVVRRRAAPDEVPAEVKAAHVGLGMCRTDVGDSLRAAMPTKLAEFLASGRPVVVNPGLGDMDALVATHRCGVVVSGSSNGQLDTALDHLQALLEDPQTPDRCRGVAEEHFDLDKGVSQLVSVYQTVTNPPGSPAPDSPRAA